MENDGTGRITVTRKGDARWGGRFLLLVDGEEVLTMGGDEETFAIDVEPGRRKVKVVTMHRASQSNLLDLEVLEGGTSPLGFAVSEAGNASSINIMATLTIDQYEIWRLDNDPGKPTT